MHCVHLTKCPYKGWSCSNDETLFENVLGNADYQWTSKDVTTISGNSPNLGSEAVTDTSEILQPKSENVAQADLSCNFFFGQVNDPASLCPTIVANVASSNCVADKSESINEISDKVLIILSTYSSSIQ